MGNGSSAEMDEGDGVELQTQGEENLWTLCLQRGPEGEGEGVCVFSRSPGKGAQADLCRKAVEHLRLLRHPNIIKYLASEFSDDQVMLVTEPVIPVLRSLERATTMDSIVVGWRGLGAGLDFLHQKACLSHNNLTASCVFVNVLDSQWKLGGLETAAAHKSINKTFLASISAVLHEKAIPPEDKERVSTGRAAPIHARDVWGLGHLIIATAEEAGLEALLPETCLQYIQDHMLNQDPKLRPTVSQVLAQPWMSNKSSLITDFLSKLTLKTKAEKDGFFRSLVSDLHHLSPSVVAEHIIPLLITPLVMAEPVARQSLWLHLLLPVTAENPRPKVFDSSRPCPLLEQDLFKSHVLPLVLNLLESRDYHVRLTLLAHLRGYAPLCDHKDLVGVVLPEVLVGLKDTSEEMVEATLHALGELVPLLGADVVMGTNRKQVFTDAQPRSDSNDRPSAEMQKGTNGLDLPHQNTPPLSRPKSGNSGEERVRSERSREDRLREMKEKREQQRLKRMTRSKLGEAVGDLDETVPDTPPTNPSPQYSPSISHDEVEYEVVESGTSLQRSEVRGEGSDEQIGGEWEGFEEEGNGDDWGESWSDIEDNQEEDNPIPYVRSPSETEKLPSSKLQLKPPQNLQENDKTSQSGQTGRGDLSAADVKIVEKESVGTTEEIDLFADMAPKICPSGSFGGSTTGTTPTGISTALQYQPEQEEATTGDWDSEDWNEV